mgnify:FL=1|jgi:large subunit ribosomal protein L15
MAALHELKPAPGAVKTKKRLGRGEGTGNGGTAGAGHKGQKARTGYSKKIGFEGGQMPLQRRVPKFGFKNPNRVEFRAINLDVLEQLATTHNVKEISPIELVQFGLAGKNDLIKVLGRGEVKTALTLRVHKVSQSAAAAIAAAGGSVSLLQEVSA